MKKKIKDLTSEECDKICQNQKSCKKCPLRFSRKLNLNIYCFYELKGEYKLRWHLEREVEVDE